jgi:predicted alpha-1,2-mannosidase
MPALPPGEKETIPNVNGFEKRQPVAVTLGTAYDQWCLGRIAGFLDKKEEEKHYMQCALNYKNIYNAKTDFFHPKDKDGKFVEPLDYSFDGGPGAREYYGENNGWTYRWDVPHNVADLVDMMGGRDTFIKNLDDMFVQPLGRSKFEFFAMLPDHTGNVGQFSMANEPCLHIPYLYNYAGQPWKTQKRIHTLINQWFRNDLMGLPGDEDGGGTSAFVVFSQLGFYPVTPGFAAYNIGSPFFEYAKITLSNGKVFEVEAQHYSSENKYIQSATLNGKAWNKPWFEHSDIANGGKLVLVMGNRANKSWGAGANDAPPSAGTGK